MTNIDDELSAILKRLAANTYTKADYKILYQALESRSISLATGERAVAVGGSINNAVIITGDNNNVYEGPDAEAVYKMVQEILKSFKPSALLTHAEFSKSAVAAAEKLAGYWEVPIGRDEVFAQIKSLLAEPTGVIVLHGAGGIGKTRLLLELPKLIPSGASLQYVCTRAESIEYDLTLLDRNGRHVIVVDDAHRFIKLYQLGQVLLNPELDRKVTLILTTRSVFKDSVTYQLGLPAGYQRQEIEVEALKNLDIDQLLQTPPCEITDEDTRHAIVHLAKGEPLIAGIAARLVQHGESIIKLNRDDVLTQHLNDIIRDLTKSESDSDRYISYLEVLAALGTLDLNNQQLREKVQLVVDIKQAEEDRIVEVLVEAGLVDRYWRTLKITSEVLADHILIHHFFQTKQADYQKKIIEPFLQLKPKQILTTLAQAEVKGE
ncbi:MAG TPA: ATP-binding protein, partial [Candidatus Sericytochromatia bacterium]